MASLSATPSQPLAELVAHLFTQREAIINKWRSACEQDPSLSRISFLSREEFNNLLLPVLEVLEERLLNKPTKADPGSTAQAHGLHRWHIAHDLMETIDELNYLTQMLHSELRAYSQLFSYVDKDLLLDVQQHISQLMQLTINGSIQKYDELQRLQAANRANTLQLAVEQMPALTRQRGDVLRELMHDLRGSLGIVNSAVYLLEDELSEQDRLQFMDMLSRNLGNVQEILTSLMELSRLEASQEQLQIESVDAG